VELGETPASPEYSPRDAFKRIDQTTVPALLAELPGGLLGAHKARGRGNRSRFRFLLESNDGSGLSSVRLLQVRIVCEKQHDQGIRDHATR